MTRRELMALGAGGLLLPRRMRAVTNPILNHILSAGQSLAGGGGVAITTSQPVGFNNFTLNPSGGGGFDELGTSLIGLAENPPAWAAESISSAMAAQFTSMAGGGTNIQHIVTKAYQSNTGIADLTRIPNAPGTPITGNTVYQNVITQATNAQAAAVGLGYTYGVRAMTWQQGESDKNNAAWGAAVLQLLADIRYDMGQLVGSAQTFPIFTDQIQSTASQPYPTVNQIFGGTPGPSLVAWTLSRDNLGSIYCVTPKYFFTYADNLHLINTSYRLLGEYYGAAMYRVFIQGKPWVPTAPRRIWRDSNVIYCQFLVPRAPLVIDTTLFPDKGAGKGFEYWDASGSPPSISSVAVVGDTAVITLSATPTGSSQTLRYAYTGNSTTGQSGSQGGNIHDSNTTAGILSGTQLVNWAVGFTELVGYEWDGYAPGLFPLPMGLGR